jgi:hypothetical protein
MLLEAMATGFSVRPGHLSGLADDVAEAASEMRQAVSHFTTVASPEPGLFGLLGPAAAAEARYRDAARRALDGLRAIAAALDEDVAAGLRATAAGYLASDEAGVLR